MIIKTVKFCFILTLILMVTCSIYGQLWTAFRNDYEDGRRVGRREGILLERLLQREQQFWRNEKRRQFFRRGERQFDW